jgi:hypothetical protein
MIGRMPKRSRRRPPPSPKRPPNPSRRRTAKRAAKPHATPPAGPAKLTVSADELGAVYEELEGLRGELSRVAAQSSARDYELRTALAELEILRMNASARTPCPHCGKLPDAS